MTVATLEDFETELDMCVTLVERLVATYQKLEEGDRQKLLARLRRGGPYQQLAAKTLETWTAPPTVGIVGMGRAVSNVAPPSPHRPR